MTHKHGTYDSEGRFIPQVVRLGTTQSGKHGLFTNGFMAWPLTPTQFDYLTTNPESLRGFVEQRGFVLASTPAEADWYSVGA